MQSNVLKLPSDAFKDVQDQIFHLLKNCSSHHHVSLKDQDNEEGANESGCHEVVVVDEDEDGKFAEVVRIGLVDLNRGECDGGQDDEDHEADSDTRQRLRVKVRDSGSTLKGLERLRSDFLTPALVFPNF